MNLTIDQAIRAIQRHHQLIGTLKDEIKRLIPASGPAQADAPLVSMLNTRIVSHQGAIDQLRAHMLTIVGGAAPAKTSAGTKRKVEADASAPPVKSGAAEKMVIYTDGSAKNNGNPDAKAGSAAYVDEQTSWRGRAPGRQTSSRAELYAAIVGAALGRDSPCLELVTDSEYVQVNVTNPTRLQCWVRNGWKRKDGQPVLNTDLWRMLWALIDERRELGRQPIVFRWVKGHAGNPGNTIADKMADEAVSMPMANTFYAPFPGVADVLKRSGLFTQTDSQLVSERK